MLNFIVSTSLFSSVHTSVLLSMLLSLLHVHVTHLDLLNHFLRKLGHFTAYGVLGGLLFRAWRETLPARPVKRRGEAAGLVVPSWTLRWASLAWALAVLAGAFDEIHQSFAPSRRPSVHDVVLDSMGAMFLQLILMLLLLNRSRAADAPNGKS